MNVWSKLLMIVVVLLAISGLFYGVGLFGGWNKDSEVSLDHIDLSYESDHDLVKGRQAWLHADQFLKRNQLGHSDQVNESDLSEALITDGIWYDIVNLDQFVRNENVTAEERSGASKTLAELVVYFKNHPKRFKKFGGEDLDKKFEALANAEPVDEEIIETEKEMYSGMTDSMKWLTLELADTKNDIFTEIDMKHLRSQIVLDRLIKEKYFPGSVDHFKGVKLLKHKTPNKKKFSDDFLLGTWTANADYLETGEVGQFVITFKRGQAIVNGSEGDDLIASYKVISGEDDNLWGIVFSYEAIIEDPFSDDLQVGEMGFEKVFLSMAIHSADCIELDPEKGKIKSTVYHRVKY